MHKLVALLLVLAACGERPLNQTKMMIIGDSTVATRRPFSGSMEGWGAYLGQYLPAYEVENAAIGGKSSKSYYSGFFKALFYYIDPAVVFIQFGHNDMQPEEYRHTDPQTTFKAYLHEYVKDIRLKNGKPVLVTPMERLAHTGCVSDRIMEPYAIAMREYANSENIQLIDLHSYSIEILEKDCFTKSVKTIFTPGDTAHLNHAGAKLYAQFIAIEFLKGRDL